MSVTLRLDWALLPLIVVGLVMLMTLLIVLLLRRPRRLKIDRFTKEWKELQDYCSDRKTWKKALLEADKLLDKALKRRRFKGRRMGERLVSAQRALSDNDSVWYAHNLCKKIRENTLSTLRQADVKQALVGFRQALKDLGAL